MKLYGDMYEWVAFYIVGMQAFYGEKIKTA